MKKTAPVAPSPETETIQTPSPDLALAGQPSLNRARDERSNRSPFLSTLGCRSVAVLAGNLIALSLLLFACQDSTAEVIMTPIPGVGSSLPSSSPPPESGAADPAMRCAHGDLQVQVQQFRQTGDPQATSIVSGLIQASPAHPGPIMQGNHPSLRPLSVEVALRRIQPNSSSIELLKTEADGRFRREHPSFSLSTSTQPRRVIQIGCA